MFHTTDRNTAKDVLSGGRSLRGSHASNTHDGCLRRDDAPRVTFFSALDTLYPLSPHPVNSEPGELAATIPVSLDNFYDNPDEEYRLYFVACTTLLGHVCDEASLRVTVMFARRDEWQWCEERGLIQLDMSANSLLCRTVTDGGRASSWEVASHYYSHEVGLRPVNLAVTVAGDTFKLAELPQMPPFKFDVFHALRPSQEHAVQCPSCTQQFFNPGDMYAHYHVGSASLSQRSANLSFLKHEQSTFKCPVEDCMRSFTERKYLSKHLRVHLDARPYLCRADPECGRFLKTKWSLEVHERTHNTNPFVCQFDPSTCKKRFKNEKERDIHEELHVEGATPFKCGFADCDYACNRKRTLERHQSTVHRNHELLLASQSSDSGASSSSNRERLFGSNVTAGSGKSLSALDFAKSDPAIEEILSLRADTSSSADGTAAGVDGDPSPKVRLKRC